MSANIWNYKDKLFKPLLFLTISALFLLQGCTSKYQYTKGDSRLTYYPTGKNGYYSKSSSSGENYSSNGGGHLTKGQGSAAMHRATLRPYSTFGIRYYPKIEEIGSESYGIASWYGPNFHGKQTSCGETYDMHGMTAAHKTLPMHTIVKVTNRKTGKSVKVRVNDRGPFVDGRIIDLSFSAGKALGLDKTGTAPVKLEVLSYDNYIASYATTKDGNGDIAYGVQLGSFSVKKSAENLKTEANIKYQKDVKIKTVQRGDEIIYKVVVAGFNSENSAVNFKKRFGLNNAVVVAAD